ncbi:hypothetical protein [Sphingobacterium sp.]|uniref:hypothetical protein n=1 Tax=Sphingobacterium sp. TaxID=341027 RepID=UPI002FDAA442
MAEEEVKNPMEWPKEATEASDFDFMMVGKDGNPIMKVKKQKLNEIIVVQGESMPAIQGGTTSAAAVALSAGPTGQNRWFDASWGYWKYNNTVLKNPLGTDGIPQGNDGTLYWDGTALTWKISKMQLLPQVDTSTLVAKSDVKSESVNMFDKASMVLLNTLINSSGGLQTVTGWHCAKIDITNLTVGQAISFFGKTGAQGLYYAFYNGSTLLSFAGYNPTLAKTVTKPTDATLLYIDIKAPGDADATVYSNFMVNLGTSIKPYQPYEAFVTSIDNKKIAPSSGGEAYDQPLNTTDSVKFESVLANDVEVDGTLKSGTISNPPTGLVSGEFWLDVTDSATHPILRRMA